MKTKITREEGTFYLDTYFNDLDNNNTEFYLGTLVLDTKRNSYYIIPTKSEKYGNELQESYKKYVEESYLKTLSPRVNLDKNTGELKVYASEMLEQMIELDSDLIYETEEDKENKDEEIYLNSYIKYINGQCSENQMMNCAKGR